MKKTLFLLVAAALFVAVPSFAQSKVCVDNHSGHRMKFLVSGHSGNSKWSEDYNSGEWRCTALTDNVAKDGETFSVNIAPPHGGVFMCHGVRKGRVATYTGSITYIVLALSPDPGCKPFGD